MAQRAAYFVPEEKLADPTPNQPLALTLGAAAVTLVVVIGVLAGPSVVSCFNGEGNMGQCLRGKMTDAGILPSQSTALATPEQTAPEPTAATPAPDATAPQPDVTPPAAPDAPSDLISATFGLLRAEPDGSVVIAGSGTPGSEVQVFSNGDLLGQTTVEPSGDWVLVPDAPIPPGGTEITLGEAGKPGQSAEAFVVVINPDKSSEPLVVASTPGAASEVLQGLTTPPAGQSTDVATATPAPAPAQPEATAPTKQPTAEPAPTQPTPAPGATTPPATSQPTAEPAAEPATTAQQPTAPTPEAPAANAETAVAAATPAPTTPPTASEPAAVAPPTIDAIEIEGDRTFFAGGGPEGATMRLYVDDTFIADATVSDGRWLVEAGNVLTKPSQRIRVDMLQLGSAQVASRAEVDFVVDLPKVEPPVAVAQADQPATPAPAAEASAPSQPAAAPSEPAQSPASQSAAPATPTEPSPAQPAASPTAPATPAPPTASDETSVPTMVATAVGDPEAARFASGKAIIRTGDNLWTIARRVYGAGIKYTTIYEANNGQIRDPDRIYPGQVFDLPSAAN
ncbi:LysM peptidoglycan-binding domain-containing protein [Devosia neptuniae]|uniref:LysM peptidoglycan-binding domain-containing protein n=1 Tax=Devosia neptuniae TaxID=191302 RepID=A0ABY6CCU1_9HYPH|nr:LysM peptidoglycan-binding domain-containing protein [Devosia neptuniae]UXN70050.1 LysM peptidoglycan-binding domain-containing protein [Devosia neptuniae]